MQNETKEQRRRQRTYRYWNKSRPPASTRTVDPCDAEQSWYWSCWQEGPWSPSATLTPQATERFKNEPRIWLNDAVDLMAFGGLAPVQDIYERAARRRQASRALCEAARLEKFSLLGSPDNPGDKSDPIPPAYFDWPRHLGSENNSLRTDLSQVSEADFAAAEQLYDLWFSVRINTGTFLKWLSSCRGSVVNKGGRPQEFNWSLIEAHCRSLVTQYGKPSRKNKKLPTQAQLIELVTAFCTAQDLDPGDSTIRKKVSQWLQSK